MSNAPRNYRHGVLQICDGAQEWGALQDPPQSLTNTVFTIPFTRGDLDFSCTQQLEYVRNRGDIIAVNEGDEEANPISFSVTYTEVLGEAYRIDQGGTAGDPTAEDFTLWEIFSMKDPINDYGIYPVPLALAECSAVHNYSIKWIVSDPCDSAAGTSTQFLFKNVFKESIQIQEQNDENIVTFTGSFIGDVITTKI